MPKAGSSPVELLVAPHELDHRRTAIVFSDGKVTEMVYVLWDDPRAAHVACAYLQQSKAHDEHKRRWAESWQPSEAFVLISDIKVTSDLPEGMEGRCCLTLLDADRRQELIVFQRPEFPERVVARSGDTERLVTHYEFASDERANSWIAVRAASSQPIYEYDGKPVFLPPQFAKRIGLPEGSEAALDELAAGWARLKTEIGSTLEKAKQEARKAMEAESAFRERVANLRDKIIDAQERIAAATAREAEANEKIAEFNRLGGPRFFEALGLHQTAGDALPASEQQRAPTLDNAPYPSDYIERAAASEGVDLDRRLLQRALIANLVAGAAGQILLITGPPGVGKSTLGMWLPRALGAHTLTVAVRPGWLDPSDFLGYFDPRLNRFLASAFVEFLVRASENPSQVHALLLDEMNLARIENYGADLLTALERSRDNTASALGGEDALQTYPELLLREAQHDLAVAASAAADTQLTRASAWVNQLKRYGPALRVPNNLYVIGTLNNDETTHGLSPKVLDRSLVLRIPRSRPSAEHQPRRQGSAWAISALALRDSLLRDDRGHAGDDWRACLRVFGDTDVPGLNLGWRARKVIGLAQPLAELLTFDNHRVLDDLMALKMLAGVRFYRDNDSSRYEEDLVKIADRASDEGYEVVAAEINAMLEASGDVVQYAR